ncbi:hypothetical protein QWJ07_04340 [Frankia sp. RB7]|nr:hypothetical protein [Frankia sp. RB7]
MRSIVIAGCLLSIFIAGAAAQQSPAPSGGTPPDHPMAGSVVPKAKSPAKKLSRLDCASICSKAVSETILSDEEQKQFDLCAAGALCWGRTPPLVYQPYRDEDNEDGGIGSFFLKKYRDIMG